MCLNLFENGVEFFTFSLVDTVVVIHAAARLVGRNNHDVELIDLMEFACFRLRGTGHAGELFVETEVVLNGDRRKGLRFFLNCDVFLRFERLVKTFAEAASGKDSSGVLVNDEDFAVLNHIMHVFFIETVCTEELGNIVEFFALEGELFLEFLFLLNFFRIGKLGINIDVVQGFEEVGQDERVRIVAGNQRASFFREVGFVVALFHGEEEVALNFLKETAVLFAARHEFRLFHALEDLGIFKNAEQFFMLRHAHFDLKQLRDRLFLLFVGGVLVVEHGLRLLNKAGAEQVLTIVEVRDGGFERIELMRGVRDGTGNDQRSSGFIDEDRVDFVDDGEIVVALNKLFLAGSHAHVAEVVETEFAVGSVGDVARVLRAAFLRIHLVLNAADRKPEVLVDESHPFGVALGEVVVDRDELAVFAGKRIEVKRHGCDEGFAFAGRHFRDFLFVERNAADDLDIERDHVPGELMVADDRGGSAEAAAGIFDGCKSFAENVIKSFALGEAVLELLRFRFELLVCQRLILFFELVDAVDERHHALDVARGFAAENGFQNIGKHRLHSFSGFGARAGTGGRKRDIVFAERTLLREIGREAELEQTEQRNSEIRFAAAAVGDNGDCNRNAAVLLHKLYRLLDAAAFGHNVFRNNHALAGLDREAAFENELIVDFVGENGFEFKRTGDFLTDEETSDGGGDDGVRLNSPLRHAAGEFGAETFAACGVDEHESALEEAVAVLAAAKFEVTCEQSSGVLKFLDDLFLSHSHFIRVLSSECIGRGRFNAEMKINFLISDIQRNHGIETCEQKRVRNLDLSARNGDSNAAVTENRLRMTQSEHEVMEFHQFSAQIRIELIGLVTFRTQSLKIFFCNICQIELDDCIAAGFRADKIELSLALFHFHDRYNSPVIFIFKNGI